jgi:hypothetical protein
MSAREVRLDPSLRARVNRAVRVWPMLGRLPAALVAWTYPATCDIAETKTLCIVQAPEKCIEPLTTPEPHASINRMETPCHTASVDDEYRYRY